MIMVSDSCRRLSINCICKLIMILGLIGVTVDAAAVSSVPTLSTAFGSYQVTMMITGANMTGPMSTYYYTFVAYDPISDVYASSVVLSTFQYYTHQFKFRLTLPTYSSNNFANIGVQVLSPCSFAYLKFYILYMTQQSSTYMQINSRNFTCSVANGAIGTNKTESLNFPTRLSVSGTDTVKTVAFLSSIVLQNEDAMANKAAFAFSLNTPAPTVSGNLSVVTLATPATVTEIFVTLFIIKTNLLPEQQVYHLALRYQVDQSQVISTSGACFNSFGIPSAYGGSKYDRNCTIGLSEANDDYNTALPRQIDFDVTSGSTFQSCVNSAQANSALMQQLFYGVVCFYKGICANSSYYFSKTLQDCNPCTNLNGNCISCNISTCFKCASGFYPSGSSCLTCTISQCSDCQTNITCNQCQSAYYVNSSALCSPCTNLAYCTICSSSTICTTCVNSTYAPDNTGVCTICYQLLIQCLQCSNYYTCTVCNTSYYPAVGGNCFPCSSSISYCDQCSNGSICTGCQTGYFLTATNVSCIYCGSIFPNCAICSSNTSCTTCQLGYYSYNATSCLACTLTGCVNCTSNSTCVECQTGYYLTSSNTCQTCAAKHCINCPTSTTCTSCESDFYLINNACECIKGWQVTNVCTTVLGCATAVKINSVSSCIFCNSLSYFIINGTTCVCRTGYKLINSLTCVTICGDSLILGSEQCDDGNTDSGDGCSSICMLESNYDCQITAKGYQCIFKANFTVSLQYIWRDTTSNSATYYFSISPQTPNFNKQQLSKYFVLVLSPNSSFQVTGYTYADGVIQCNVVFNQSIQNLQAQLQLNFDSCYFNTTNFTYSFLSTGTNAPLIVSGYTSQVQYLKIGSYVVLGLAGVILLLSITFEKMIGIETINYLQLLVFCRLVYVQNDLLLDSGLSSLQYVAGYSQIGQNLAQTHTLPEPYRRLNFNNDFLLNFQTGLVLMGISLLVLLIFCIYRWRFLSNFHKSCSSKDEYRLKQQTLNSKTRFIYERVILTVACITLFQAFAALRIQARALDGQSQFNYFLVNLVTLIFAVAYTVGVLTYQVISIGKAHESMTAFCSYSAYYVGYYAVWALLMTPIMAVGQMILGMKAISVCGGVVLINLMVLIVWRPYNQVIHNIGVIINHVVVLGFLGFEATMQINTIDQSLQFIISFTLLGLIIVMEIIAVVRLYFAYRPAKKESPKLMRNQVMQMQQQSKIVIDNLEKDFLNKSSKKQPKNRQQDEDDFLRKLKNRLKQEIKQVHTSQTQQI